MSLGCCETTDSEETSSVLEGLWDASLGSECESVDEDEAPRKRDRIKSKAEESHVGYDVAQRRNIFDDEELDIELGVGR